MTDKYFFKERSEKLCDILVPHLFRGLSDLYKSSKKLNLEMGRPVDKILITFQLCLKRVPNLPRYQLEKDYNLLKEDLENKGFPHDWMQKTIIDIFKTYAKSHLINLGADEDIHIHKYDLNLPHNCDFLHKCYIESARCFWQEPFLFSDNYSTIERQRNSVLAQNKIRDCIYRTIRSTVPLETLVSKYNVTNYTESTMSARVNKNQQRQVTKTPVVNNHMPVETGGEYYPLNRENLEKLQIELANQNESDNIEIPYRTPNPTAKTNKTQGTHNTRRTNHTKKTTKNITTNHTNTTEIGDYLDEKMSKDNNIKTIQIKRSNNVYSDYSNSDGTLLNNQTGNGTETTTETGTNNTIINRRKNLKNKLARINELMNISGTERSSTNTIANTNLDDTKTNKTQNTLETIDILTNNTLDTVTNKTEISNDDRSQLEKLSSIYLEDLSGSSGQTVKTTKTPENTDTETVKTTGTVKTIESIDLSKGLTGGGMNPNPKVKDLEKILDIDTEEIVSNTENREDQIIDKNYLYNLLREDKKPKEKIEEKQSIYLHPNKKVSF